MLIPVAAAATALAFASSESESALDIPVTVDVFIQSDELDRGGGHLYTHQQLQLLPMHVPSTLMEGQRLAGDVFKGFLHLYLDDNPATPESWIEETLDDTSYFWIIVIGGQRHDLTSILRDPDWKSRLSPEGSFMEMLGELKWNVVIVMPNKDMRVYEAMGPHSFKTLNGDCPLFDVYDAKDVRLLVTGATVIKNWGN